MALSAAAIAKIAAAVSDKENREKLLKIVGTVIVAAFLVITLILSSFSFLISGLFGLLSDCSAADNWKTIRKYVMDVFEGIDKTQTENIKNRVYEFMPDFSINLSKAAIQKSFEGSPLLMYDTSDVNKAKTTMSDLANDLKDCAANADFIDLCRQYKIEGEYSFEDITADTIFLNDENLTRMGEYADTTVNLLSEAAANSLNKYSYEEIVYAGNHGEGTGQSLTVTTGNNTKTVQYFTSGGVNIYIPKFIAYYQARLMQKSFIEGSGNKINDAIEAGIGNLSGAKNEEELQEAADDSDTAVILDIMQIIDLREILISAVNSKKVGANIQEYNYDNGDSILKIFLNAPDEEEWLQLFNLSEDAKASVDDYLQVIEQRLKEIGIPESDLYINLDSFFQAALFTYFEGFFNLPVDSSELKENGIYTKYGDYSSIHKTGLHTKLFEDGVTLRLTDSNTEVKADLLPSVKTDCFDDIVIYDVWTAAEHPAYKNNALLNCDAITVAYYLDTEKFEDLYGFAFPQADIDNPYDSDVITILVEYSCLSECYYDEARRGESILDEVTSGSFPVGVCHSGEMQDSDFNNGNNDFRHDIEEQTPHVKIRMDFVDGWAEVIDKPTKDMYLGVGANPSNYNVSPIIWFKGFRTETDDDVLAGLAAAQ